LFYLLCNAPLDGNKFEIERGIVAKGPKILFEKFEIEKFEIKR